MPIRTILLIAILSTFPAASNENAAPVAKAAEDETKPIIENNVENVTPVVKAARVVYQGIVYVSGERQPAITCNTIGSALSLRKKRSGKEGYFSIPNGCTQEVVIDFILFQENNFSRFSDGDAALPVSNYKYMSAFVHYIGDSDEWMRVFIEVNENIKLKRCDEAPSYLQNDCTRNVATFEDYENSRRVDIVNP